MMKVNVNVIVATVHAAIDDAFESDTKFNWVKYYQSLVISVMTKICLSIV